MPQNNMPLKKCDPFDAIVELVMAGDDKHEVTQISFLREALIQLAIECKLLAIEHRAKFTRPPKRGEAMKGQHNLGPKPELKDHDKGTVFEVVHLQRIGSVRIADAHQDAAVDDERAMTQPYTPPDKVATWLAAHGLEAPKDRTGQVARCLENAAKSRHEFMPKGWRCGIDGCVECERIGGGRAPTGEPVRSEPARAAAPSLPADVWPKYVIGRSGSFIAISAGEGEAFYADGIRTHVYESLIVGKWLRCVEDSGTYHFGGCDDFVKWLRANNHIMAADEIEARILKRKPRAQQ